MAPLALLLALAAPALPARAAPVAMQIDWTHVVAQTSEGGYRMGNSDAAIKLVQYGSRSCPFCAKFARESGALRTRYIASGKVSFEYRDALVHPQDGAAALLGVCGGTNRFFPILDAMFETIDSSVASIQAYSVRPEADDVEWWASAAGYSKLVERFGIGPAEARRCLANPSARAALAAQNDRAFDEIGIDGTPSFLINGKLYPRMASWAQVERMLLSLGA